MAKYKGIPPEVIEEIKQRNNIVSVVGKYVNLEKTSSQNLFGLCPFHTEKTPSFSVSPQKQIFYCFGCHKGGDMITFIMDIEKINYLEALRVLADQANMDLPTSSDIDYEKKISFHNALFKINMEAAKYYYRNIAGDEGKQARDYLFKRGIRTETIKKFGIGYAKDQWDGLLTHLQALDFSRELLIQSGLFKIKKENPKDSNLVMYDVFRDRLMFPIFDAMGRVVAFGGRVFDDSQPKYINSPETPIYSKGRHLYGYHLAKKSKEERLIVVEGYMDAIAIHQAGFDNAVASLGTALTSYQATLLRRHSREVVIAFDADSSGRSAMARGIEIMSAKDIEVFVLVLPEGKDPDDYIKKNGPDRFRALVSTAKPYMDYQLDVAFEQSMTNEIVNPAKFQELACSLLAKEENQILRELYAVKIAEKIGVSALSVIAEIERRMQISEKKTFISQPEATKIPDSVVVSDSADSFVNQASKEELYLLCILACVPEAYLELGDPLDESYFSPGTIQRMLKDLLHLISQRRMSPPALIELAEDEYVNGRKLADLLASGCMKAGDLKDIKEVQSEISRLYVKIQIRHLTSEKERYTKTNYHELKPEEKRAFNEIQKRIDQLKTKI